MYGFANEEAVSAGDGVNGVVDGAGDVVGEEQHLYGEDEHVAQSDLSRYTRIITNIEELHYFGAVHVSETHRVSESYYTITRILRLPFDAPEVIRLDGFVMDDMHFEFTSMERVSNTGVTEKFHSIPIEIITYTSDTNAIRDAMPSFVEYEIDGYVGILTMVDSSIITAPKPAQWERHYIYHTIQYNNIVFGDTDSFAVFFNVDGIVFSVYDIEWLPIEGINDHAEPGFNPIASEMLFNAIVTYRGWYSVATIPGFTTTATYEGLLFNFDHFPSVLYEISFSAQLSNSVELQQDLNQITQPNLPGLAEVEILQQEYEVAGLETPHNANESQLEISIGNIVLAATIVVLLILVIVALKKGWFRRLFGLLKKKGANEDDFWDDVND